jgi:hypothetical protein
MTGNGSLVDSSHLLPITLLFVTAYLNLRDFMAKMTRAILTDVQFWIPTVVLALGVALLVFIHGN